MSKTIILSGPAKDFESIKKLTEDGVEYWEARELMPLLGYAEWRKFNGSIERAKQACEASDQNIKDHFVGVDKMIILESSTTP
ncbi:MAG: hypothetical protein AAB795_03510 [Patescibacteria group bacterium]